MFRRTNPFQEKAMKKLMKKLLLVSTLMLACCGYCGPGDVDLTFDPGSSLNGDVKAVTVQPDGKLIVGGEFSTVAGLLRNRIARLNEDGTGDASFNPGTGADDIVEGVAVQPDGKVLVGGWFTHVAGTSRNRIARLNADGSFDASFDPGTGADDLVFSVVLQPDGKVLIAGYFTRVNGTLRSYIARLNPDGSVDATFAPGGGPNDSVYAIALQPDGKIVIGGLFTTVGGVNRNGIARLNANGSLDASFDPGSGVSYFGVACLALQPDAKILIGGSFYSVNGASRNSIARLNADGSLDASFDPGSGSDNFVEFVTALPDGKVLIGGQFSKINGMWQWGVGRLNPDGSIDESFDTKFNPLTGRPIGFCAAVQTDGKVIIGGSFDCVNDRNRNYLVRLNQDASLDLSFNPNTGIGGFAVHSVVAQPDGKVLIGGPFIDVQDRSRGAIARLNLDGTLDAGFDPGAIVAPMSYGQLSMPVVYSIARQSDGKVLIGGYFTTINGTSRNCIARLNQDGTLDTSFDPGTGCDYSVYDVALQPDGKIIIAGGFRNVNGVGRNLIARLNSDGSLDPGFVADVANPGPVAVQPDGKILVAGIFIDSSWHYYVLRLNSDGSPDAGFNTGAGFNDGVRSLLVQPDGRILVGGWFSSINGMARNRVARLNPDGSVDTSFDPGTGPDNRVESIALQRNSKVLIGGAFTNVNGVASRAVCRLNADGGVDLKFNAGTETVGEVHSIALTSHSRILVGGEFWSVNGVPREFVARLSGSSLPIARIRVAPLAQFPGITNPIVIASCPFRARVILDGSESSSEENDPLDFQWREGTNVFANAVTTTNVMPAGSHEITLTVSSDAGSNSATAMVDVITPAESVRILIGMVERSTLAPKKRLPLMATLHAAEAAFSRGRLSAGLPLLAAFQTKVEIQIARADPALAAQLIDSAQTIIDALDVRPSRSPFEKGKGVKP
jgi:uncharacterized delta-60 repeat protein